MKKSHNINCKVYSVFLWSLLILISGSSGALAQDASSIANNASTSMSAMPGLLVGLAYLAGIIFGAWGIVKTKQHVDSPQQVPLKDAVAKFLAGGALFALPTAYGAMAIMINGGSTNDIIQSIWTSPVPGSVANSFNTILETIVASFESVPGLVSGVSYLLGLILGFAGILKLKEHVENPQQVQLREGLARFATGGALFTLPIIFRASQETIGTPGGGLTFTAPGAAGDCPNPGINGGLDQVICNLFAATDTTPWAVSAACYLFGVFIAVWGLLKIRDHVLSPQQVPIWDGVLKLFAAGALFALPTVITAAINTLSTGIGIQTDSGFSGAVSGGGLDKVMVDFTDAVHLPMRILTTWFCFVAGFVLIAIAILRLLKSTQEGPRGPAGFGTIMTFITGGALLAFGPMIGAASASLFGTPATTTNAALAYTTGMDPAVVAHSHAVISAVIKFMIVVGVVSVARGIFIFRAVAEGAQQASLMAGVTHIVGGALAINLGPLINAVQNTLGLAGFGVNFI